MKNGNLVNIINFIRAVEPRPGRKIDLFEPVREQMALAKQYALPTTWLLQYDALVKGPFVEFLKREMPEGHEVGIWFEVVEEMAEAAGIEWRGRWSWDWHTDVGFSVGYTPEEREKLADVFVEKFVELFGRKPDSMGSWLFDAHLLDHLHRKHGVSAACNCKDQYGTDGYTLWGGYWANAYYPSKRNSYLPAQRESEQIPVPVFRMLGSDPLYQYDAGVGGNGQAVVTLEPVYAEGGGSPAWIDWFLNENFAHPHLAMAYTQAGQENSFGWPEMTPGLPYQYQELARLRDAGTIRVETLAESGKWFRERFAVTPASAVVTKTDWKNKNHAGIWYLTRFGRVNLFRTESRELVIRDWQRFREECEEPFLRSVCTSNACAYDALPVLDGMLWHPAKIAFPGGPGEFGEIAEEGEALLVEWRADSGDVTRIRLTPEALELRFPGGNTALCYTADREAMAAHGTGLRFENGALHFRHNSFEVTLRAEVGSIEPDGGNYLLRAAGDTLCLTAR